MSLRANTLTKKIELKGERVHSLNESVGVLRAIVIGGALFVVLTVPLMFNIQTKKYVSETTAMNLKLKSINAKMLTVRNSVNMLLETYFPNSQPINIDGKKFYIRNK